MKWYQRKNGISVLIPTQNEEAVVALSILSFLEFGDELIVVDNGSTDRTKEIVRDLESIYPKKIRFYDMPELPDLYHNRQYAFSKSSYRWVVRADSDYVAYTDGDHSVLEVREMLLSERRSLLPKVYAVPQVNIVADFRHTGLERESRGGRSDPGRYVPTPISDPMLRIYEVFPGLRFGRLGRWEGARFNRFLRKIRTEVDYPLWMQCSLKSNRSYLFRSERTDWRELGNYTKYPTLESYVHAVIRRKYGTEDLDKAAHLHFQRNIAPFLQEYDPDKYHPYPKLVREQMARNCIYRIKECGNIVDREYLGIDPLPLGIKGELVA